METINVSLYGGKSIFGGKEKKLNVDVIYCNKTNECSFYKIGQCLRVRSFGGCCCKYGNTNNYIGYTSRAMKYKEFHSKWKSHPKHNLLKSTTKNIAIIGDYVLINTPFVGINEDGTIKSGSFTNKASWILKENFTTKMLYNICTYSPQAMMGGTIRRHEKEEVPKLLFHTKEIMPEFYAKFLNEYPMFDKEMDYVGKLAKLSTIRDKSIVDFKGNKWLWDDGKLIWQEGRKSLWIGISFDKCKILKIELVPPENMEIKITDNLQVSENTIILD